MNNSSNHNEIEETYNSLIRNAQEAEDKGDFERAIKSYIEALQYKPKQVQLMGELCWCLGQAKKYDEMLEIAKNALLIAQKHMSKDNIGRFYYYIAQYYKVTRDYKTAIKYFNLAIVNKPYFVPNYIDSAYCFNQLENYKQALNLYDLAISMDSESAKKCNIQKLIDRTYEKRVKQTPEMQHIRQGLAYVKAEEYQLANSEFFKAVEYAPNNEICLLLLFQNELRLFENPYKIIGIGESIVKLLDNNNDNDDLTIYLDNLYSGLGKCYEKVGNEEKSEEYLKIGKSYYYINKAKKAIKDEDYVKALEEYKKALEYRSDGYDIFNGLIEVLFKLEHHIKAMDFAMMGLKRAKTDDNKELIAKYYSDIATVYDLSGDKKAEEYYKKAINTAEDLGNKLKYCRNLAFFYSSSDENFTKTIECLNECMKYIEDGAADYYDIPSDLIRFQELLDENSDLNISTKHYNIGGKYFNERNFEEAAKEMKLALDYVSDDLGAMDALSRCYFKLKRYDECYDICYEGFSLSQRLHDYRYFDMFCYNLGNILYNSKKFEKALEYYNHALNIKPDDVDYLYFVAACHRNLGRFEEAVPNFQKAHEINPEDKNITYQLAVCKARIDAKKRINEINHKLLPF